MRRCIVRTDVSLHRDDLHLAISFRVSHRGETRGLGLIRPREVLACNNVIIAWLCSIYDGTRSTVGFRRHLSSFVLNRMPVYWLTCSVFFFFSHHRSVTTRVVTVMILQICEDSALVTLSPISRERYCVYYWSIFRINWDLEISSLPFSKQKARKSLVGSMLGSFRTPRSNEKITVRARRTFDMTFVLRKSGSMGVPRDLFFVRLHQSSSSRSRNYWWSEGILVCQIGWSQSVSVPCLLMTYLLFSSIR